MAWLVYLPGQATVFDDYLGLEPVPTHWILLLEASGPRDPRSRSTWQGMPILAAWDEERQLW